MSTAKVRRREMESSLTFSPPVGIVLGQKPCSHCKGVLPVAAFNRDTRASTGLSAKCRPCSKAANNAWRALHPDANREWKAKNRTRLRKYKREYHAAHPDQHRRRQLRAKFDLTPEQYAEMLLAQGGVCAICKGPEPREGYALAVDHDHATGEVRGILCSHCNRAVGWLADQPERVRAAAVYLEHRPWARP